MITDYTRYHREYYHIRRAKFFEHLGQTACVQCGSTIRLQIDHIDPALKSFDIKDNLTLNDVVKKELEKCQVLCYVCHRRKTSKEQHNKGVHGSYRRYFKHRCRCAECVKWHKTYTYGRVLKRQRERTQNP